MTAFHRILADVDALATQDPALHRSLELAARTNATVKVVDVLPEVPNAARRFVTEAVETQLVEDRLRRMHAAVGRLTDPTSVEVALLRGRPAHSVAAEADRGRFDLIVRRRGPDRSDPTPELTSSDRRLVRAAPCSVWLLGQGPGHRPRRILAAVDVSRHGDAALAKAVLAAALTVAGMDRADLTVFHAYHLSGEELLMPYVPASAIHDLRLEAEAAATARVEQLIAETDCGTVQPHVAVGFGEPETAIAEYARTHAMDLIVLGVASVSALARLVIGSTAEHILSDVPGSLLFVKTRVP